MRKQMILAAVMVTMAACTSDPDPTAPAPRGTVAAAVPAGTNRIAAAEELTRQYAGSQLAEWKVRATATGADCRILLVETPVIMEKTMVEAMHYGAGTYHVRDGGVERFYRDHSFRGVTYKDGSGHRWRFGAISEAEPLSPCR